MSENSPYLRQCSFCGDGLLRLMRCGSCDHVAAVCDECELIWKDLDAISKSGRAKSSSAFPNCSTCGQPTSWSRLEDQEIKQSNLDGYVRGSSI